MTDFDRKLIEKARRISRWHYDDISILAYIADTAEASGILWDIRRELLDSARESV